MPSNDDESRHKREEAERKAKRKASKGSRSEAQLEKERKGKEYREAILRKQGQSNASKRPKRDEGATPSSFQKLFDKRTQGFQIEFAFRNAPPRLPVGPCFVGNSLDAALMEQSVQYKPLNAIEMNHTWKLHSEDDIGVPLAPSAMNPDLYQVQDDGSQPELHPDDEAILNWKGSLGDSTQDIRKIQQKKRRAAAFMVPSDRSSARKIRPSTASTRKKANSRVLNEDQQTWMKKTTYLSNDHTRRVHDYESLAQTKSEIAANLDREQSASASRLSFNSVLKSFEDTPLQHPTNKKLKAVKVLPVLPSTIDWGRVFTHVVIDKAPTTLAEGYSAADLRRGVVSNVESIEGANHMSCDVQVPFKTKEDVDTSDELYRPLVSYDLDVVPLKTDESPHASFCFWIGPDAVKYVPVPTRIRLATGRPAETDTPHPLERRPLTDKELRTVEQRAAEVDRALAAKYGRASQDDGEDDYDDSDSDDDGITGK